MNIAEELVFSMLSNDADIVAMVSNRIKHKTIPTKIAMPCIVFLRESTEYLNTIHSNTQIMGTIGIAIHCLALSDADAQALANLVSALDLQKTNRVDEFDEDRQLHVTILSVVVNET